MDFFKPPDLEYFSSVIGKRFKKTDPEFNQIGNVLTDEGVYAKTAHWAELISEFGFPIKFSNNWQISGIIRSYTWARIYLPGYEQTNVYFTIGVGSRITKDEKYRTTLEYKIDCQRKNGLTKDQIEIFDNYIHEEFFAYPWETIDINELEDYNWGKLVDKTIEFIKDHEETYKKLVQLVWPNEYGIPSKLARITWNINGWTQPSGRIGKTKNETHEAVHGFGHEEWLFDGETVIDGYKYGFLEPIHKAKDKHEGEKYNITLFTRNAIDKITYWVTTLENVEVLSRKEAENILKEYKRRGWFKKMKADLKQEKLDPKSLDRWVKEDSSMLFNIKFDARQLSKLGSDLVQVENDSEIPSFHYVLMSLPDGFRINIGQKLRKGYSFDDTGSTESNLTEKGKRKASARGDIELNYKHNEIQSKLMNYLQSKYGVNYVKRECEAYGSSRVDISHKTSTGIIFYEIKTYNNPVNSIRNAIGQLLEYSLYPDKEEAEKIVIVSHVKLTQEVQEYFKHLKQFIKIPMSYLCFDTELEEVVQEIA